MVAAPGAASLRVLAVKQIVILGGGTGGTMTANRLRRRLDAGEAAIHVVDRDVRHVYQPGLLLVRFGLADARRITRPHVQADAGGPRPAGSRASSPAASSTRSPPAARSSSPDAGRRASPQAGRFAATDSRRERISVAS